MAFRDDEGVEEAKAEPVIEEEAPALRRGQTGRHGAHRKPLGRLFDNDALIKELNELDEKLNPDPFPEDAFGGDDDNFDAVEACWRLPPALYQRGPGPDAAAARGARARRVRQVHAAEGGGVVGGRGLVEGS